MTHQGAHAAVFGRRVQFGEQARLADPGITLHQDHRGVTRPAGLERQLEPRQLGLPADEGREGADHGFILAARTDIGACLVTPTSRPDHDLWTGAPSSTSLVRVSADLRPSGQRGYVRTLLIGPAMAAVLTTVGPVTDGAALAGIVAADAPVPRVAVGAPTTRAVEYRLPVGPPTRIVRGFAPPATRFGPGHRGVDLRAGAGGVVRAAAAGTVAFAGPVAGRGVVVLAHADGVRTEYEPLAVGVRAGARVPAGGVLGRTHGQHGSCPPDGCVHWSARRVDGAYFDPLTLLAPLGPVRLLPGA
jgi:hypothetical protein